MSEDIADNKRKEKREKRKKKMLREMRSEQCNVNNQEFFTTRPSMHGKAVWMYKFSTAWRKTKANVTTNARRL
jgi:hypothetical protein